MRDFADSTQCRHSGQLDARYRNLQDITNHLVEDSLHAGVTYSIQYDVTSDELRPEFISVAA
jgi:hypothetical protein